MNKNILSLDPMYSHLHTEIAKFYDGKKLALLSSLAMKIYLKGYDTFLISKMLNDYQVDDYSISLVKSIKSHYRSKLLYNDERDLNAQEISYMARFANLFENFVLINDVGLVLIHNDLRWHHAIAIEICKRKKIPYLVTEQGLFRPYTTVLDNKGVNAYSSIMDRDHFTNIDNSDGKSRTVSSSHNSYLSMLYFFAFIFIFKIESSFNSKLRYQHNNYSIKKYTKRFFHQLFNGAYNDKNKVDIRTIGEDFVFVPLQLEDDTQILIHSDIKSNQEFIFLIEDIISSIDVNKKIIFKKHPNDTIDYVLKGNSSFVKGSIVELASKASLTITINSSAAIDVIKTGSPLFLFGDSIYAKKNVATKVSKSNFRKFAVDVLIGKKSFFEVNSRRDFINYLFYEYSLHGAGFSYEPHEIKRILKFFNCL